METHENLVALFRKKIAEIITKDPILNDLDKDMSVDEINNQLSLENGDSMKIFIRRGDGTLIDVIVKQTATLKDLKMAIKRHINVKHKRLNSGDSSTLILNWKYIWKTYSLAFDGKLLDNDKIILRDFGVCNKSELCFLRNVSLRQKQITRYKRH